MVKLERIKEPFSAFYLNSFSYVQEEEQFYDALRYQHQIKNNQLMLDVPIEIDGFQNYQYSFATYLIKNEYTSWLGYINLYNSYFIQEQVKRFTAISLHMLKIIQEKNRNVSAEINFWIEELESGLCKIQDIEKIISVILKDFPRTKKDNCHKYYQNYQKRCMRILNQRPQNIFIEFAIYGSVEISQEKIGYLLADLYKEIANDEYLKDCNILLPIKQNQFFLNQKNYEYIDSDDTRYYFLKKPQNMKEKELSLSLIKAL